MLKKRLINGFQTFAYIGIQLSRWTDLLHKLAIKMAIKYRANSKQTKKLENLHRNLLNKQIKKFKINGSNV